MDKLIIRVWHCQREGRRYNHKEYVEFDRKAAEHMHRAMAERQKILEEMKKQPWWSTDTPHRHSEYYLTERHPATVQEVPPLLNASMFNTAKSLRQTELSAPLRLEYNALAEYPRQKRGKRPVV